MLYSTLWYFSDIFGPVGKSNQRFGVCFSWRFCWSAIVGGFLLCIFGLTILFNQTFVSLVLRDVRCRSNQKLRFIQHLILASIL